MPAQAALVYTAAQWCATINFDIIFGDRLSHICSVPPPTRHAPAALLCLHTHTQRICAVGACVQIGGCNPMHVVSPTRRLIWCQACVFGGCVPSLLPVPTPGRDRDRAVAVAVTWLWLWMCCGCGCDRAVAGTVAGAVSKIGAAGITPTSTSRSRSSLCRTIRRSQPTTAPPRWACSS